MHEAGERRGFRSARRRLGICFRRGWLRSPTSKARAERWALLRGGCARPVAFARVGPGNDVAPFAKALERTDLTSGKVTRFSAIDGGSRILDGRVLWNARDGGGRFLLLAELRDADLLEVEVARAVVAPRGDWVAVEGRTIAHDDRAPRRILFAAFVSGKWRAGARVCACVGGGAFFSRGGRAASGDEEKEGEEESGDSVHRVGIVVTLLGGSVATAERYFTLGRLGPNRQRTDLNDGRA